MKPLFIVLACLHFSLAFAQKDQKVLHINKTISVIKLDGILDEAAWKNAEVADSFYLNKPYDSTYAKFKTEVKVSFDTKFFYVSAVIHEPRKNYTVSSLKRDFESGSSDVFSIYIDTFKDKLNGFQFSLSPLNVQREGLISLGTEIDNTWDNKWFSAVKNYDDYWVLEIAIPFTTLRYKVMPDVNQWHINFARAYLKENEISSWSPVPRNFPVASLAFAALLQWDQAPPKPGINISLIPYISGLSSTDFVRNQNLEPLKPIVEKKMNGGMDAKVAVTPSLNLDLTVNPDFSQVEVDQQQTNLSRFELYYPEKRQFFIENSDLFGKFGFPNTRPFFSRRIGLTTDPSTGLAQKVPILAGARLSGKLNKDWRIGLMNMQTQKIGMEGGGVIPATNYSVATVQRRVFKRSSLGFVFLNKENSFNNMTAANQASYNKYNRVAGLEFNYYSPDNKIEAETYYHQSWSPSNKPDAASFAHYMGYHHPHLDLNLGMMRIGKNYNAEMGYVPRVGVYQLHSPVQFILNPKSKKLSKNINSYGFGIDADNVFDLKGKVLDSEAAFYFFVSTPANTNLSFGHYIGYTYLYNAFDPTNASDNPNPDYSKNIIPLPVGPYHHSDYFINVTSSQKHNFYVKLEAWSGKYYAGTNSNITTLINYRVQPYGKVIMALNYNDMKMPFPYNSAKYWLIGPKAELSFSKTLFLSTYFQYNSQINNTNINTRLQWRYKPVSDIFLVYTDNYFSTGIPNYDIQKWTPKNRALILKMTYWLNM